jgi:hypothetical protein
MSCSLEIIQSLKGRSNVRMHRPVLAKYSKEDPLDKLCDTLFARITESVLNHESNDWARDYDRLCAMICRVIAQSALTSNAKCLLTRRLIQHVVELEKWWARLGPK